MQSLNQFIPYKVLVFVFIGIGVMFMISLNGETTKVIATQEALVIPKKPILIYDYATTAANLYEAYRENEVLADEEFKGKQIVVVGLVKSISKNWVDQPIITFATGTFLSQVQCEIPKEEAIRLHKNQSIAILGRCSGMVLGIVCMLDGKYLDTAVYSQGEGRTIIER